MVKKTDLEELERSIMELRRGWDRVESLKSSGWKIAVTVPVTGETIEYSVPVDKQTELQASLSKKFGNLAKKIVGIDWTKLE